MRSPSIDITRNIEPKTGCHLKLEVPTSKSRANRMLFLAAIDEREIHLSGLPTSSDVLDMLRCLELLGLDLQKESDGSILIKNSFPACETNVDKPLIVPCGYGGTTTRFLAALLALGKRRYYLEPDGYMRQRPMKEIVTPLQSLGVECLFETNEAWLVVQGDPKNKLATIEVDASRSTQFASALAMTVSKWNGQVEPLGMHASEDYFTMTLDCISEAKNHTKWVVPVDFSSLSYPLALAAVSGEVLISNVHGIDHLQPDSIFIEILKEMGAKIESSSDGLKVCAKQLKSWSGDCGAFPDLVPTLAFVCAFATGDSNLSNLAVLRHKECDRFAEVNKILQLFGVNIKTKDDGYIIQGLSAKNKFVEYEAPDDHRMIMVAALFMRHLSGGKIKNWDHVKKSYPTFFDDLIDQ